MPDIARGYLDELESILELVKALDYLSGHELEALRASRSKLCEDGRRPVAETAGRLTCNV